jgi:hypothetical protein
MMAKMGGMPVETSAAGLLKVSDDLSMETTGKFMCVPAAPEALTLALTGDHRALHVCRRGSRALLRAARTSLDLPRALLW